MMQHLFNRTFTVYRRTGQVLDRQVLSSATQATRRPKKPYLVEVVVESSTGAIGSVEVSGTKGGSPASEVLSFTGLLGSSAKAAVTTAVRFDASTFITVTPSGWGSDPTVTVRGVSVDGSPVKHLFEIVSALPGRLSRRPGTFNIPTPGSQQFESSTLFLSYSTAFTPREGDECVDTASGERWRIEAIPTIDAYSAPNHWEVNVKRAEA